MMTPEIEQKLRQYDALLHKWQKSINLVSPSTLPHSWARHILDSVQLTSHIPQNAILADCGAGAGFPGLVLAILRPDITVHLIESDHKKCEFMRFVSRETKTENVVLHSQRIEHIAPTLQGKIDIMTARALADLSLLLSYAQMLGVKKALLLKGERYAEEIEKAQKQYDFNVQDYPSQTEEKARILVIDLF